MGFLHRQHAKLRRDLQISLCSTSLHRYFPAQKQKNRIKQQARNIDRQETSQILDALTPRNRPCSGHHREKRHVPLMRTASTKEIKASLVLNRHCIYARRTGIAPLPPPYLHLNVDHVAELAALAFKREFDKHGKGLTGYFTLLSTAFLM